MWSASEDEAIKCAGEHMIITSPFMLWRNFSASVKGGIYHFNPHLAGRINTRVSYISLLYTRALKADEQVVIYQSPHTHLLLLFWVFHGLGALS